MGFVNDILIPVVLVVAPVLGYIPQYVEIQRTANPKAFSPLVILILLLANILRIFFWMEKRFELALLLQSVVMIGAQLLLLELVVRLRSQAVEFNPEGYTFMGYDLGNFWNWNEMGSYIRFLGTFSAGLAALTFLNMAVLRSSIYTETIGTFALMTEATLAIPQFWQNYRCQSTRGLRVELVAAWTLGDAAKTALFVARRSPIQFLVCGLVQLLVDFGIFYQMRVYGDPALTTSELLEEDVLASTEIQREFASPKEKTLSRSADHLDFDETDLAPKRQSSFLSRPASSFHRTM